MRLRWPIVVAWLAVIIVGGWASGRLSALQSNVFSVPGTDSEHVRNVLQAHFGDRSDGAFTVVFRVQDSSDLAVRARLQAVVDRAATAIPTGKGTALEIAGPHVLYGNVISTLNLAQAKGRTGDLVEALGHPRGAQAYVTGAPAIQHDLDPIFSNDLKKGESIALPIALLVLLLVFGLSWAVTIPFVFAASTVFGTLGIVYVIAHYMTTPTYVTNLVFLIGLGIAIDYSLLIVYRFREELSRPWPAVAPAGRSWLPAPPGKARRRGTFLGPAPPQPDTAGGTGLSGPVRGSTVPSGPAPPAAPQEREAIGLEIEDAVLRTMETAGRAVIFSGGTVAIGLALLLFMPLPFMRSMGVGGFLIPIVSILAAATLQPALLSIYGRRGTHRAPVAAFLRDRLHLPVHAAEQPDDVEHRFWARLARSIMRRKWRYVTVITALLVAAAIPVAWLQLTPGATAGIPQYPQSVRGLKVLEGALGPGAIAPSQVLVDTGRPGGVRTAPVRAAISRLLAGVEHDPEVSAAYYLDLGRFVDQTGRYAQVIVATRHEYGSEQAKSFVHRLRGRLIPAARFPAGVDVEAGGAPPQGVDFLHTAYGAFPWLVLAVLALTYLLLMRAFRSLLLPLKAVVLNLLSVGAAYGALVVLFRFGFGKHALGLYQFPQIEGWIPIFLFAMLFGLSMDYEVFLVSRMREAWDETHDNGRAVAIGLERTGRIVTAAAVIMVAAFCGFMAGSIVGLQEFGAGLAVAIFLDATIVRAVMVPSLMAIMGRYNWWLPDRVARLVRVSPSPLHVR
jgi:putative drug exporter of the RND superfamily